MKTDTLNRTIVLALILAAIAFTALMLTSHASASAPSGLPALVATSSANAVSTTASSLFASSTCAARIITTRAQPIMLTFSDYANQTPTATFGVLQPASTTVAYDSGQYGCGLVKAYAFGADTITLVETR